MDVGWVGRGAQAVGFSLVVAAVATEGAVAMGTARNLSPAIALPLPCHMFGDSRTDHMIYNPGCPLCLDWAVLRELLWAG